MTPDSIRQFLSLFGIRIGEIDIHVLEKNTLVQDRVTIGTFFLNFERMEEGSWKKVNAQGIFTIRDNEKDVWVKFTSPVYTFKVHFHNRNSPAATLVRGDEVIQVGPLGLDTGST